MKEQALPYKNVSVLGQYSDGSVASGKFNKSIDNDGEAQIKGSCLLIIDGRALDRQCLAQALIHHGLGMDVCAVGTIDQWRKAKELHPPAGAVLFNVGGRKMSDLTVLNEISRLAAEFKAVPIVILAESDELAQILQALEYGARGYIPTSVGVEVCIGAIELAIAGGIFVPASSVLAIRHLIESNRPDAPPLSGMFTLRQAEVVQALRKGKANKIIAYELNLRESTVKVHIRNIMKKLKATNRTEVAYKLNDLFPSDVARSMIM